MIDQPITREEWLALHLIRQGKEPSKAQPSSRYRNPANRNFDRKKVKHDRR